MIDLRRWLAASAAVVLASTAAAAEAPPPAPPPASPAPGASPEAEAPGAAPAPPVLTLAKALETGRAQQPQLRQARAAAAAADARADEARAPLLPQVQGNAAYQRTTANVVPRPGFAGVVSSRTPESWNTLNYWTSSATASQLVYDFGQTTGRWSSAKAAAVAQRDTEAATRSQTDFNVRIAFFNARAAGALVGVARDNLTNQAAHVRQTEGFVAAGTRPAIDLALARTQLANAQLQLINAENGYLTAKVQLNQAMGIVARTGYDIADETFPPVEGEEQELDPLAAEALGRRPDVAALDQTARSQELLISAIRGGYAPSLGVSTGLTTAGLALDSSVWNWNAQVTLTWNIFQGGLTSAQEREARSNFDAARAQADTLRLQVQVDVEQARLAVRAARAGLVASDEALANAREQLRLAERRYTTGVGSAIELGDSQVAMTTAAAQRVQAEYNLSGARAQLIRALGRVDLQH
jgi:outer membrane protein